MKKNHHTHTSKTLSKSSFQFLAPLTKKTALISLLAVFGIVFAADFVSDTLDYTVATASGSSNSRVSTLNDLDDTKEARYWNKGNNSTIIDNFFTGYYFDSSYGFFRLDWSPDTNQNVRIVSSTPKCGTGYGYKIGGFAQSQYFGLIDFDYNSNTFVYYCESDKKLHGYSYSQTLGFQNFEGIGFEIIPNIGSSAASGTGIFVNDTSVIPSLSVFSGGTSNFDYNSIFGDTYNLDATKESIFYIIK